MQGDDPLANSSDPYAMSSRRNLFRNGLTQKELEDINSGRIDFEEAFRKKELELHAARLETEKWEKEQKAREEKDHANNMELSRQMWREGMTPEDRVKLLEQDQDRQDEEDYFGGVPDSVAVIRKNQSIVKSTPNSELNNIPKEEKLPTPQYQHESPDDNNENPSTTMKDFDTQEFIKDNQKLLDDHWVWQKIKDT